MVSGNEQCARDANFVPEVLFITIWSTHNYCCRSIEGRLGYHRYRFELR